MNFAPYQPSPPEHARPWSPPRESSGALSPRASLERRPWSPIKRTTQEQPYNATSPPPLLHPQPKRGWQENGYNQVASPSPGYQDVEGSAEQEDVSRARHTGRGGSGGGGEGFFGDREGLTEFDTTLGLRLDYEACLAYLLFPPIGAILLLILERKSDFVRFHAWQSALMFTAMFVVQIIFWWSSLFSWVLFLIDLGLIGWFTLKAYGDAAMLDRYEAPIFGRLASRFLDDE